MKFEDLKVWQRSSRLCAELYKHFKNLKDFGFRDQITRSALSIPSNISEGVERDSPKDFLITYKAQPLSRHSRAGGNPGTYRTTGSPPTRG